MRIKIFIAIAINCFWAKTSLSQTTLGLSAGINYNTLKKNSSENYKLEPSAGSILSGFVQVQLSARFSILCEPGLITKNYKKAALNNHSIYQLLHNKYLTFPLEIRLPCYSSGRFTYSVDAGGFTSYWFKSIEEGQLPDILSVIIPANELSSENYRMVKYKASKKFDPSTDNRFESGVTLGAVGTYAFSKQLISVKLFILDSFSPISKAQNDGESIGNNQSFNLQISYAFKL